MRHSTLPVCRPISASLSRLGSAAAVCAAIAMACSTQSKGQIVFWDPIADGDGVVGGGGIWNLTDLSWDPTGLDPVTPDNIAWPNTAGSVGVFGGTGGIVLIDTGIAGGGVIAGGLTFAATGYTISSDEPSEVITLGGVAPTITVNTAGDMATITSTIAGTAGLVKAGDGTLVLNGANTYSGVTVINGGALRVGTSGALSTGAVQIGGASNAQLLTNAGGISVGNNITVQAGAGTVSIGSGAAGDVSYTGSVTLNKGVTLTAAANSNAAFAGAIAANGNLISKEGAGTVEIGGFGTVINGGLDVKEGTLRVSPGGDFAVSGGSAVSSGSTLQLSAPFGSTLTHNGNLTNDGLTLIDGGGIANFAGGTVENDGVIQVTGFSTADFGASIITTSSDVNFVAGLREVRVAGAFNEVSRNTGTTIKLGLDQAQVTGAGPTNGWVDNSTYIYSGQIFVGNTNGDGTGSIAFGKSFDDSASVVLGGTQVFRNTVWNSITSSGELTLAEGWHDIEFRFGQGTGGYGFVNGIDVMGEAWNNLGFGIDLNPLDGFDTKSDNIGGAVSLATFAQYILPLDPGTNPAGTLFRTNSVLGGIQVDAGSILRAGGATNAGFIQMNGDNFADTRVEFSSTTTTSTTDALILGGAINAVGTLELAGTMDSALLDVIQGGNLTLEGGGTLNLTGTSVMGAGGRLTVTDNSKVVLTSANGGAGATVSLASTGRLENTVDATLNGLLSDGQGTGVVSIAAGTTLSINSGNYSGLLTGPGGFNKAGGGTLVISGQVNNTGPSRVTGGILRLTNIGESGPANALPAVTIEGGTLDALVGIGGPGGDVNSLGTSAITLTGGTLAFKPKILSETLAGQTAGLEGRYFTQAFAIHNNNTATANYVTAPDAIRIDPILNMPSLAAVANIGQPVGMPSGVGTIVGANVEGFAVMWKGLLRIENEGLYTFISSSDDGSAVFIDGIQVVSNEGGHGLPGGGHRGTPVQLSAGLHTVTIRLTQGGGGAGMVFAYEGPDQPNPTPNPFPGTGYPTNVLVPASVLSNATFAASVNNAITVDTFALAAVAVDGFDVANAGTLLVRDGATLGFNSVSASTYFQNGLTTIEGSAIFNTASANASIVNINATSPFAVVNKSGRGTLTITGTSNHAGGTNIVEGTLVGSVAALGTGPIDNNGRLIVDQPVDATLSTGISGLGDLVKRGIGKLTLTGDSSYFGNTLVQQGTLEIANLTGSATGFGNLTMGGGTTLVSVNASVSGNVIFRPGSTLVAGTNGRLLAGDVTFGSGTTANFSIGGVPGAAVVESGLLASSGLAINVASLSGFGAGTYPLFSYGGAPLTAGQFGGFTLGSTPGGTFYYALINNSVSNRIDFSVEAFGALNTWTGAVSGVWDTVTDGNWTSGAFASGQQVTFNDSGINKTVTGGPVSPQRITIDNSVGNNYLIENGITGTVAGGIAKSGAGLATFTGRVNSGGPVDVTGGTLRLTNTSNSTPNEVSGTVTIAAGATVQALFGGARPEAAGDSPGSSALSGAPVVLNGGTLEFTGQRYDAGTGGLTGMYFNQQTARSARVRFETLGGMSAMLNTSVPELTTGGFTTTVGTVDYPNAAFGAGAPFGAPGGPGAPNPGVTATDNLLGFWKGKFVASSPGLNEYIFAGRSDDGLVVYVNGQLVLNRNNFQGNTLTVGPAISLPQGEHDILIGYFEGTGGAGVQVFRTSDGNILSLAETTAAQPYTTLGNNVTLGASSAIRAANTYGVTLGNFLATTPGTTLTTGTTASMDGLVRFGASTFSADGTYTFETHSDVALGAFSNGGNSAVTIAKTGAGNLILDNIATAAQSNGTVFQVNAGRLVAQRSNTGVNPLGTASIHLNGVGSVLQFGLIEANAGASTFDNAVVVNENARMEFVNHSTTTREIIIGSAANGISIATDKILEMVPTSAAQGRINGVISGGGGIRVSVGVDAGNFQSLIFLNAANTFTGRVLIENGGQIRVDNANGLVSQSLVDIAANGRLEFFANNTFSDQVPRIVTRPGSFIRINANANPGTTIASGTIEIGPGRILEHQTGNALTGGGQVVYAPNAYRIFNNTAIHFPATTTTVGMRAQDTRPLDVIRMNATITGAGDGVFNAGWGATAPGTVIQIFNGNRNISATNVQELNGQIITNDGAARNMDDGNRLDIGPLGGVFAATNGTTLAVVENLQADVNSGKVTIGTHIPIDNLFKSGTVAFANGGLGEFAGTTDSVAKAIDVVAGAALEGRANATGNTGFGPVNASNLGVNLARGTLRVLQATANQGTAGTYSASVGKVFATGAATLHVNRNTANAAVITEMRLGGSIERSPGATISLLSQNNALGSSERVRFLDNANAPGRVTVDVGGTPTVVNMVAPHFINISNNLGSFVDYNPAQDPTTGPGFLNTQYVDVQIEDDLAPGSIVNMGTAFALTQDRTVAAARLQGGLSEPFTLTSQTGGFIITTGAAVGHTISANLAAAPGRELVIFAGGVTGGIHNLNGTLTSDSGLVKFGLRTLGLGADNSATLFGDIYVNEASLVIGADNRLGAPENRVILNGGNLRPAADFTISREIIAQTGGGTLTNDGNRNVEYAGEISGEGGLTIAAVNGNNGINRLTSASANTFEGGLIIANGVLEFSRNDQLGALPEAGNFQQGHVAINDAAGTNATLRLASGAGLVSTGERQFTVLGTNSRFDVPGAGDVLDIGNDIRGSGSISKNGPGTLVFSNSDGNGYIGTTLVNAGALLVNNTRFTGTGAGTVTVNSGATLGGSGIIEGAIVGNTGATLSPGASLDAGVAGTLLGRNGLTLQAGANFRWSLETLSTTGPGDNFDRLAIDYGTVNITSGANFTFDFATGAAPSADIFWTLPQTWQSVIQVTGFAVAGTLGTFNINNAAWEEFGTFSTLSSLQGYDLIWTPIPEPSALTACLAGLSLIGLKRFRRRSA